MEIINFKYQLAIFGNYEEITPTSQNIKFFVDSFAEKNFVPSQNEGFAFSVKPNGDIISEKTDRLNLSTEDKKWVIKFENDRIDLTYVNIDLEIEDFTTQSFILEAEKILAIIEQKFPKKNKRLGFNTKTIIRGSDSKTVVNKLNNAIPFYADTQPTEWMHKWSTRKLIEIKPTAEIVNVNSQLRWAKANIVNTSLGKNESVEGIFFDIDINTLISNTEFRFEFSNLNSFLECAIQIESEIKTQYLKIII